MANLDRINLLIDSSHRTNLTETATDFSVSLTNGIRVKMIRLKQCCIPLVFYNITESNNSFSWMIPSALNAAYTITITPGKYTIYTLIIAMNTAFAVHALPYGSMSISYDEATGYFTTTFTPIPPVTDTFITSGSLLVALGYDFLNNDPITAIGSATTTAFSSLFCSHEYFKLSINYLDGSIRTINNYQLSTSFVIENNIDNIDDYMGKKLFITNSHEDTGAKNNMYDEALYLQNFRVSLRNHLDEIVSLNGVNWYCILEILAESEKPIITHQTTTKTTTTTHKPLWLF